VSCALFRFQGGSATLGDGLRAAGSRLPQIAAWALLAATVGMVLRAIEERVSWIGKWVVSLIGLAWTVVTYFVVPILAVERGGPAAAVRRSAELLRKTWGEDLAGQFSLGLVKLALAVPGILLLMVGVMLLGGGPWAGIPVILLGVLYFAGLAIVLGTVQQ